VFRGAAKHIDSFDRDVVLQTLKTIQRRRDIESDGIEDYPADWQLGYCARLSDELEGRLIRAGEIGICAASRIGYVTMTGEVKTH